MVAYAYDLKKSIEDKTRQVKRYERLIENKKKQIEDFNNILKIYPDASEIRDYVLSKFSGYKFFGDKNCNDFTDVLARYSRYNGLTILNSKKIFDKNYLITQNIIHIRRTNKWNYGSPNVQEEYEVNINYEEIFDSAVCAKIDKIIIKYVKSGKIKVPKKNISTRLQKLLAFH